MKRQHQFHMTLAAKYFSIARTISRKMGGKPDPELIKAHQEFLDIGEQHRRIAILFPECNEFAPVR